MRKQTGGGNMPSGIELPGGEGYCGGRSSRTGAGPDNGADNEEATGLDGEASMVNCAEYETAAPAQQMEHIAQA